MNRLKRVVLFVLAAATVGGCTSEPPSPATFAAPETFSPSIPPPSLSVAPTVIPSPDDFNGKYVAVNHVFGDELDITLLHSPTVRKLGNRDFLVGEVIWPDGRSGGEKNKVSNWLPVETIDSLIVFESKDQAIRETTEPVGQKM